MLRRAILILLAIAATLVAKAYWDTMRDPVVERLVITSNAMPPGGPALKMAHRNKAAATLRCDGPV